MSHPPLSNIPLSSRHQLSAGVERILMRASGRAVVEQSSEVTSSHVLTETLAEDGLATVWLKARGLSEDALARFRLGVEVRGLPPTPPVPLPMISPQVAGALSSAGRLSARDPGQSELTSEHLIVALITSCPDVRATLESLELPATAFEAQPDPSRGPTLAVEESLVPQLSEDSTSAGRTPDDHRGKQSTVLRIIDANLNRLREACRVLDDLCRFALNNADLAMRMKSLRHRIANTGRFLQLSPLPSTGDAPHPRRSMTPGISELLASRNVVGDVGTQHTVPDEERRETLPEVATANLKRAQEASRSLEEFGKLIAPAFAADMKQIRYELYDVEQLLLRALDDSHAPAASSERQRRLDRLTNSHLYVLITDACCPEGWQRTATAALAGGADILQLREKSLDDRELLQRARWLRRQTARAGALFVMNDRADIAVLADADGLHVGQEELSAVDARAIIGSNRLLGISTHDVAQLRQAIADGADYVGVGPVFPSSTKTFEGLAGVDFVREAGTVDSSVPQFAIGGIDKATLPDAISAGARRIAVTGAVSGAEDVEQAVRELRQQLSPV